MIKGIYNGSASSEGYIVDDDAPLCLSQKDQKWLGIKDTIHYS